MNEMCRPACTPALELYIYMLYAIIYNMHIYLISYEILFAKYDVRYDFHEHPLDARLMIISTMQAIQVPDSKAVHEYE